MKILVCGATGCIGRAVTLALRSRGHRVVEGARGLADGPSSMPIDFMSPRTPTDWSRRLSERGIESVVNCVGILMPTRGQTFERVHAAGPLELFRGAALAGVRRIVQISALGVSTDAASVATPYLRSKLVADEALASLAGEGDLDWAVLRPSLVYGPGSQSAALFATLASLPVVSLRGGGRQRVQPVQVYELAEIVTRLLESASPTRAVLQVGGGDVLSYREMLIPAVAWALRCALAFMWIYTAAISAVLQEASGVMELLARCGLEGRAGVAALVASCALNTALGLALLRRPSPWTHAVQAAAIVGYTCTAAVCMPELTIDHCGPLVKNLSVLVAVLLLWLDAQRSAHAHRAQHDRREATSTPWPASRRMQRKLCDADRSRA